jgi:prevent-host-death family protein
MVKEKTIPATEFKARCLAILEDLNPGGIIVTKHGRPVAKVVPVTPHGNEQFIGSMKGAIKVKGDLFSTGVSWDAESGHAYRRRPSRRRAKRG